MRAIYSYGTAGAILVIGALWLGSGTFVNGGNGPGNGERPIIAFFDPNAEGGEHEVAEGEIDPRLTIAERVAQANAASGTAQSVRTQTYTVQAFPLEVPLRGRTKASSVVTITPETQGVVTAVNVVKGQAVNPGDVLCTLDEGIRAAAVAQAQAALTQAQTAFDTNTSLRESGLAATNTGLAAEAALLQAQTAFDQAQQELSRARVTTKVAGVVQDPVASVGTMLSPGTPCATVVELDPMLFIANVPEANIGRAELGIPATVTTVSGQSVDGEVSYISSIADEATRSFPIEIKLPNADGKLLSGVTATAVVSLGTVPAHLLPQSVLTLNDDGELGIRSVKDELVEFHAVTIISDGRDGIWVTGLPPTIDVITMGQEYVVPGQRVNATNVTGTPESVGAETAAEGVTS
ncbi:MAG: efflux RND transporter periplasmic adaptor subunit [Devosia sp.]